MADADMADVLDKQLVTQTVLDSGIEGALDSNNGEDNSDFASPALPLSVGDNAATSAKRGAVSGAAAASKKAKHGDGGAPANVPHSTPDNGGTEGTSRDRRKLQNRVHSKNSREKKKNYITTLEERVQKLEKLNSLRGNEDVQLQRGVRSHLWNRKAAFEQIHSMDTTMLSFIVHNIESEQRKRVDSVWAMLRAASDGISNLRSDWVRQVPGLPRVDEAMTSFFSLGSPQFRLGRANLPSIYFFSCVAFLMSRFRELPSDEIEQMVDSMCITEEQYQFIVSVWDSLAEHSDIPLNAICSDRAQERDRLVQTRVVSLYLIHSARIVEPRLRLYNCWATRNCLNSLQRIIMLKATGYIAAQCQRLSRVSLEAPSENNGAEETAPTFPVASVQKSGSNSSTDAVAQQLHSDTLPASLQGVVGGALGESVGSDSSRKSGNPPFWPNS